MAVIQVPNLQMDIMLYLLGLATENKSFSEAINNLTNVEEIPSFAAAAVEIGLKFYFKEFDLFIYAYEILEKENKVRLFAEGLVDEFTIEQFKEVVEIKREVEKTIQ